MSKRPLRLPGRTTLVIMAAALSAACADDAPFSPDQDEAQLDAVALSANAGNDRAADLGVCTNLQVPAPSLLALRVYAQGVQVYHWDGATWIFDGPVADLSADAEGRSTVGTHYSGPTWESVSGSKVVGTVLQRCTPDANAIPWLLLGVVSTEGPGIFEKVTFIQRVNTVGGNAPAAPGSVTGAEARVPYTTEYLFYRAQ